MARILAMVALIGVVGLTSFSCTSKWEYKTVSVKGIEAESRGAFKPNNFGDFDEMLNSIGQERWELVGVYEKNETVHPNYGNEGYVTGLQPNVRTAEISFVFKRRR